MNVTAPDWKREYQTPHGLTVHPASPVVGARITGVDLARPLSDGVFKDILDAWFQYLVVVFPGQTLDEDQMVAFAERFGPLNKSANPRTHHNKKNPAIMLISNIREDGKLIGAHPDGEMHFHTDQCHQEKPCSATMLYGMEIPSRGGDTCFANAYYAYETLPEALRRRIDGRRAMNVYDYNHADTRGGTFDIREGVPHASHPVVRTHPVTGRKALYVNRLMTGFIEGMPRDESEELLHQLFIHQERPEYVYAHKWTPGDLVIWDNRCLLHARTDFDASERRLLRRVTVLGEKPV
ncbi:MAG: TauD/TfdA family dioxygenase [Xanthobacteraceae bacterium]|nr:TauD/TfdA family dioxygenase [Xanthobacteraceae bacterium]